MQCFPHGDRAGVWEPVWLHTDITCTTRLPAVTLPKPGKAAGPDNTVYQDRFWESALRNSAQCWQIFLAYLSSKPWCLFVFSAQLLSQGQNLSCVKYQRLSTGGSHPSHHEVPGTTGLPHQGLCGHHRGTTVCTQEDAASAVIHSALSHFEAKNPAVRLHSFSTIIQ